jgi:phosphoglycolate phosphatase
VVVFDIDGTLLDSAPGIVAGFQHALRSVGFTPPDAATLRADLGPPVGDTFTALGLPEARLEAAVAAYRDFYREQGMQQSQPYDGVVDLLTVLHEAGVRLATATAKLTEVGRTIVGHHQLDAHFELVNGTDEHHRTKAETLRHTLEQLGWPAPDQVVMVGDRHSDVQAARSCGVLPVAVAWGYGSEAELRATAARIISHPAELLELPLLRGLLQPGRR